ncbi:MAG: Lrp/AsnC family transcriptional regulator [Clostridia bacterium]|nr:Lrp/AsnC family transcriptional regulator [Clostridia bacterium]
MEKEILSLLERDGRKSADELAVMLDMPKEKVAEEIRRLEDEKIILGYRAMVNWEKIESNSIMAYIELKITPQRGEGFDKVAERIYKYPQVRSVTLMSGAFDLLLIVEGKTLQDVAMFVSSKLAPMESVISTATHFILKTYKKDGVVFASDEKDQREVITL